MKIQKLTQYKFLRVALAILLVVGVLVNIPQAKASQITARSLTLTNSAGAASGVGYTFLFTAAAATTIKSVNIDICDTASGTCTPAGAGVPTGFTSTGAAVGTVSNIGSGGSWTGTFTTNGRIRIANASNTGAPSAGISIQITGVTNPTAANSTYYARITTYSDAAWTTALDTGTVAASTAGQITVTASVDETLSFTLASATVALGTLTTATTGASTSTMIASTNATSGYNITVNGTTLTSGANTVTALTTQTASAQNTSQFGINLKANTTPSVGSNVTGSGSGAASANYATADQFRFVTGDTVASAAAPTNSNTYTVSYIANIAGTTKPGSYSTVLTYIATANF